MAPAGVFSSVLRVGGRAVRVPATGPGFADASPRRAQPRLSPPPCQVAAAAGVVSSLVAPGGIAAARQPAPRSMYLRFAVTASPAPIAAGSRSRVISNAGKGSPDGKPAQEPEGFVSKILVVVKKLKEEARRSGFTITVLLVSILLANLSYKTSHPYSSRAVFVIGMCDKAEKFFNLPPTLSQS